jgi:hypothetical protein
MDFQELTTPRTRGRPKKAPKEVLVQSDDLRELALACEASLEKFITTVHPNRLLGHVHKDLIWWWCRKDALSHQLVLLPRDHQKSALMAYRVAWELTKNPALRILYISSTSNLAVKQLKFIKDIFESDRYRELWPEMIHPEETKREKWTEGEISLDHPRRKEENIRDPSIFTAGLTTGITGLHCDIAVLDDVVVDTNAYNPEGRTTARNQASYLASIAGADSRTWVCGTRYHPQDLYNDFIEMTYDEYDKDGNVTNSYSLYEVYERQVEDKGDGTGIFLWPRTLAPNGKWFGFNKEILSKKKAQYFDKNRFRSQYYNKPNDEESATIRKSMFQYYERSHLQRNGGKWSYSGSNLNVFAAIDFAYSLKNEADSTAIVVVGVDQKNNYYILDIERFKTKDISQYFDRILRMHTKWGFRKIRCEVSVAQEVIVEDLKNNYIKVHGLALTVDKHRPMTKKEERIEATLQPKYSNGQIWHFLGGNTELLEEELVNTYPPHDDIKDALTSCLEIAVPPSFMGLGNVQTQRKDREVFYNKRFGGVS